MLLSGTVHGGLIGADELKRAKSAVSELGAIVGVDHYDGSLALLRHRLGWADASDFPPHAPDPDGTGAEPVGSYAQTLRLGRRAYTKLTALNALDPEPHAHMLVEARNLRGSTHWTSVGPELVAERDDATASPEISREALYGDGVRLEAFIDGKVRWASSLRQQHRGCRHMFSHLLLARARAAGAGSRLTTDPLWTCDA